MTDDNDAPKTLTVPDAGRIYFSLSRAASYAAASRGDLPVLRLGKRKLLRVPVAALERMLDGGGPSAGGSAMSGGEAWKNSVEGRLVDLVPSKLFPRGSAGSNRR
jgi:hypothetical protein